MYQTLLNMWVTGQATAVTIQNAVTKRWITQTQANTILATPQNPPADVTSSESAPAE